LVIDTLDSLSLTGAMDVVSPFQIPAEHLKNVVKTYDDIKTVGAFLEKQNHKYVGVRRWFKSGSSNLQPAPCQSAHTA
jgi:hypothetical protein